MYILRFYVYYIENKNTKHRKLIYFYSTLNHRSNITISKNINNKHRKGIGLSVNWKCFKEINLNLWCYQLFYYGRIGKYKETCFKQIQNQANIVMTVYSSNIMRL